MNNSIKELEKNLNENLIEKLKVKGKLTLGDIYDEFGFERIPGADYTTVTHVYIPPEIQNLNPWFIRSCVNLYMKCISKDED